MHESARRPSDPAPTTLDPWLDINRRQAEPKQTRTLDEAWELAPWWARVAVIWFVVAGCTLLVAFVVDAALAFVVGLP